MSSYARASSACACIINEKDKKKIPWRTSRGLNRENKTYQLKRFISPGYYRSQEKSKTMVIMQPFGFFLFGGGGWGMGRTNKVRYLVSVK